MQSNIKLAAIALVAATLTFAGCQQKKDIQVSDSSKQSGAQTAQPASAPAAQSAQPVQPAKPTQAAQVVQPVQPVPSAPVAPAVAKPSANSVYFAFDKSDLDSASQTVLDAQAAWLASSGGKIVIEGNCDERGTREYNLALGQRRADAVRGYLAGKGVNNASIETVSFGEERPRCTDSGEACWAQNRRADIVGK